MPQLAHVTKIYLFGHSTWLGPSHVSRRTMNCAIYAAYPLKLGQSISNQTWSPCLGRTLAARGPRDMVTLIRNYHRPTYHVERGKAAACAHACCMRMSCSCMSMSRSCVIGRGEGGRRLHERTERPPVAPQRPLV